MNILLTGGAGFIGSHVAEALAETGAKIYVVDNLSTGKLQNLPAGVEFCQLDVNDPAVGDLFRTVEFDAVVHHAAQIDVRRSTRDPLFDLKVNVEGSLRLLEQCREYRVGKFLFASTGGAIYGEQDIFPAGEDHPLRPVSPYGIAKATVERYLYYYHISYGLNAVSLRYANVYGPRQNPFGEAGVIAIFSDRLLRGQPAFIHGDGKQTRDYVYVGDIARLNAAALRLGGFHILNAGTGRETSVVELFDRLNALTGAYTRPEFRAQSPGEQRRSAIDSTLAGKVLGWKPETPLEEGLGQTVEFFRRAG